MHGLAFLIAVLLAVGVNYGLWRLWYAPSTLGSVWADQFGVDLNSLPLNMAERGVLVAMGLLAATAYGLVHRMMGLDTYPEAITLALGIWLFFVLPAMAHVVLLPKGPLLQLAVDAGYALLCYLSFATCFTVILHLQALILG